MASNYQTKVIQALQHNSYKVINLIKASENGYPDLIVLKGSMTVWIECKEPGDTLKELQRYRIDELIALGFHAACIKSGKGIIHGTLPFDIETTINTIKTHPLYPS